jgi:cardiolipin synthase A/B
VVDEKAALVSTFNLSEKYFTKTCDYGVMVLDPVKVAQIVEVFNADWDQRDWYPSGSSGLLWGNYNARSGMAKFIDAAEKHLWVQHPKFSDTTILDRLICAAARGVHVRVLCGGKHGISEWDMLDTFSSLRVLQRFGVKVHKQAKLRLHAKLILADDRRALVGSMNIDRSAFDLRRELGSIVEEPITVEQLRKIFDADWSASHHYDTPDPLDPSLHARETEFPHDPDLMHE